MPIYEFINEETGAVAEVMRPVAERDRPLVLKFKRKQVPKKVGLVVCGGIKEPTFSEKIMAGYHEMENRKGSRFNSEWSKSQLKKIHSQ